MDMIHFLLGSTIFPFLKGLKEYVIFLVKKKGSLFSL